MGSKKKKKEKQKDFKKPKLKVGKTAAKPDNYTDTSFKSKTISLPNQSITTNANLGKNQDSNTEFNAKQFQHHLSLLKHHSPNTRKEILISLENQLPLSNPSQYKLLVTSILPLIIDEAKSVRLQLIHLFAKLSKIQPGLFDLHLRSIILFIVSAMTHIQPGIRNSVSLFLEILIDNDSSSSSLNSFFNKILKNYFILMGWNIKEDKKSISLAISNNGSMNEASKKARIDHIRILNKFLQKTLFENENINDATNKCDISIHPQSYKYLPPSAPQPFSSLKLFINELGPSSNYNGNGGEIGGSILSMKDLNSISTEDVSTRVKIVEDVFKPTLLKNLNSLQKEGGDIGREANNCLKLLDRLSTE